MKKPFLWFFALALVSACSIVGVHFKPHNPKRAGKYPEPTVARTLLGDQDSRFRSCYDAIGYNLSVDFGAKLNDKHSIAGWSTMTAIALEDCDTIQMDLHQDIKVIEVNQITHWNNTTETKKAVTFYREEGALFIVLAEPPVQSLEFKIEVYFAGRPPDAKRPPWKGGFDREKDDSDSAWWGVACQSEGASMWWPCKDVVNDEPVSCEMSFSVPPGYTAVSNGQLKKHAVEAGREFWIWSVNYPINLYNITFYIGKYKLLQDQYFSKVTGDTLELNHYVLEQHYDKAKEHFKQLKDHLAVYEELFGPYPFYDDGFKLVESPYAGMEHQTAIAYGNKFRNNYLGFDYIILHETAHEWWGNSVTAEDLCEGWIHEGFATYAECLYVERTKGRQAYENYLRTYRWTIINRRPLVGVHGLRYFNYKDGDIYTKGAWVLHTLRETVNNDSIFFDIIKTFATRFKYKNATSVDFQNIVNEKTGKDYKWFFDQYLHNRFVPVMEYYQDGVKLYYRWNPDFTNEEFKAPVVLKIGPSQWDTIFPGTSVAAYDLQNGYGADVEDNVLIKYTENKRLKKQFKEKGSVNR